MNPNEQLEKEKQKLEEALEPIFHPPRKQISLADLHQIAPEAIERTFHYNESDYDLHRRESLHHHQPLHRLHHSTWRQLHQPRSGSSLLPTAPAANSRSLPVLESQHLSTPPPPQLHLPLPQPEQQTLPQQHPSNILEDPEKVQFYVGSATSLEKNVNVGDKSHESPSTKPLKSSLKKSLQKAPSEGNGYHSTSLAGDNVLEEEEEQESLLSPSKVTFMLGESNGIQDPSHQPPPPSVEPNGEPRSGRKRSKEKGHRHHKHKSRRHHHVSEVGARNYSAIIEPEEAMNLQSADLDDIASHRFDDPRGIRRHKIQSRSSISTFLHGPAKGLKDSLTAPAKKTYDRRPHTIFVELDELCSGGAGQDEWEWRETARWIKYEEDVVAGADRWGRPHVATLSFHSLLDLRTGLETGAVLFDVEETDLPAIVERFVGTLVQYDLIEPHQASPVTKVLQLRHRHLVDSSRDGSPPRMRRNPAPHLNLPLISSSNKGKSTKNLLRKESSTTDSEMVKFLSSAPDQGNHIRKSLDMDHQEDEDSHKKHLTGIGRRIPIDSEGTICLAGALEDLSKPIIGFIRLAQGQPIPNVIEVPMPVRFIFILLTPLDSNYDCHEMGRAISTLMCDKEFVEVAYQAESMRELLLGINNFLDDSIVLPPSGWESKSLLDVNDIRKRSLELRRRKARKHQPSVTTIVEEPPEKKIPPSRDPLRPTNKIFGGLLADIKGRYPHYLSDFTDGLNPQCFASAIFIYFAALSAAVTFGGLMGDKTDSEIGVCETLIVTCISGIIFSLLSGQPLVVVGTTGPVLLFDEILYQFCEENGIEFLSLRVWISIWVAIIATVVVAKEGSSLVRFFTRFTQEIFASLISLLYIYESCLKLYIIFFEHPLVMDYCQIAVSSFVNITAAPNSTNITEFYDNTTYISKTTSQGPLLNHTAYPTEPPVYFQPNTAYPTEPPVYFQPNTALWSSIMMISTFLLAHSLRQFRNSKFLVRSVRRALGDFGVPIAIVLMVAIDYSVVRVYSQKLNVPEGLTPSKPSMRGWIISPLGIHTSISVLQIFCSSFAALLIFILLFLEIQICELIVNKKERSLKKGSGFHLDLLLVSYLQVCAALLGGPWVCAATVRSVSHVAALTVLSRTHAPGEKPRIVRVHEQRLSNLLVSLLIGISVFMAPVLQHVPVAVLFGVFLYMGVSSMSGIQFFERLTLLFMPAKHHPDISYVRKVRSIKMHLYTMIQVVCLAVLWAVKSTRAALGFPFFLLLTVPVRYKALNCCFSPAELRALDGEESDSEEETEDDDPDFYKQILP